jgi:hypothetical protein|tara:strand:- start:995 stop:1207 length:213 start_codon:yes stop_codon:yes gene_type:complete
VVDFMEISTIVNFFLALMAILILIFIISLKIKDKNDFEEIDYTGHAKNPEILAEPNEEALNELDKLLGKN